VKLALRWVGDPSRAGQPTFILGRSPTAANRRPASVLPDSLPERSVVATVAASRRGFGAFLAGSVGSKSDLAVNDRAIFGASTQIELMLLNARLVTMHLGCFINIFYLTIYRYNVNYDNKIHLIINFLYIFYLNKKVLKLICTLLRICICSFISHHCSDKMI